MPIPKSAESFEDALEGFRATAEGVVRDHFARNGYTFAVPVVEIAKGGRRYAKLISTGDDPETGERRSYSSSVHRFADKATGEIFKPASFKAPAKHARGNVFDADNGLATMGPYGAGYLR